MASMDQREVIELLASIIMGARSGNPTGTLARILEGDETSSSSMDRATTGRRRKSRGQEQSKAKVKRKVSNYQRQFGKEMKKLKAKHPRTPVTRLMKRAHSATKKYMRLR